MKRPLALVVLVGALLAALVFIPSDHYLFLPDRARPVDPLVKVPGEPGAERGGIYMVDILVRKASLLERLLPGVEEGSTLVPGHVLNPGGLSESERREQSKGEMSASQKVAVAVALRELGHDVRTEAQVREVRRGTPADGKLEVGDVIVSARGKKVTSPHRLFEVMRSHRPGTTAKVTIVRLGKKRELVVGTQPAEDDEERAVMGILV